MVDSGDIKVGIKDHDGKKWFEGEQISPEDLIEEPFVVVNFERDLTPKWEVNRFNKEVSDNNGDKTGIEPPRKKYLVSILHNGQPKKFWTGNKFNINKLNKAEEDGEIPFFTSIKKVGRGKRMTYKFCSATELGHKMPTDKEVNKLIEKYEMR